MPILTSIDRLNYEELLPDFRTSKEVIIVTYSMELSRASVLWQAIRSVPKTSKLTIVACIPPCGMNFEKRDPASSASTISKYYAVLNPDNIAPLAQTFFSHHNHAKIIRCDSKAYVGSANFTMGSSQNFEAGYVTQDAWDLRRIDQLITDIRARAIPYFRVGASLHVQQLLQFAADVPWLVEQVQLHAFDERETYGDETELLLNIENFEIPARVEQSLNAALRAADRLEEKHDNEEPLNESEDALNDLGLNASIQSLLDEAASINSQSELPRVFGENDAHAMLNDYALSEKPAENPEYLEAVREAEEENSAERATVANVQMTRFLRELRELSDQIFAAVHPSTAGKRKKKPATDANQEDRSGLPF